MLDTETGQLVKKSLQHHGDKVREFYSALPGQVLGRECRTLCKLSRSVPASGEARACGAKPANTPSHRCLCRRILHIGAPSCRTCITRCTRRSTNCSSRGRPSLQRPGAKLLMSHPGVGPVT